LQNLKNNPNSSKIYLNYYGDHLDQWDVGSSDMAHIRVRWFDDSKSDRNMFFVRDSIGSQIFELFVRFSSFVSVE
jgi:hypothetical protein